VRLTVDKGDAKRKWCFPSARNLSLFDSQGVKALEDVSLELRGWWNSLGYLRGFLVRVNSEFIECTFWHWAMSEGEYSRSGQVINGESAKRCCWMREGLKWHMFQKIRIRWLVPGFEAYEAAVLGYQQFLKPITVKFSCQPQGHDWWNAASEMLLGSVRRTESALKTREFFWPVNQQKIVMLVKSSETQIFLLDRPTRQRCRILGRNWKYTRTIVKAKGLRQSYFVGFCWIDEIWQLSESQFKWCLMVAIVGELDAKDADEPKLWSNDGECSQTKKKVSAWVRRKSCLGHMALIPYP